MKPAYREFPASPRFRAHIECFWRHFSEQRAPSFRVLPDGCVDILFEKTGNSSGKLNVIGTMTRARVFDLPAGQFALGVRFRPAMAARFLRMNGLEFTDKTIPLGDIWSSRRTRVLLDRMAGAKSAAEAARLIEAALGEAPAVDPVEKAIAQLVESRGMARLEDVAAAASLSPRHFRRVGMERTGVSPKRLARILRFRHALAEAERSRRGDWAGVALECGYYDQAHLINDFREFSGAAPGRFATESGLPATSAAE